MKLSIILLLTIITKSIIAPPAYNWNRTGDTTYNSSFIKMITDPYGNVYIGGEKNSVTGNNSIIIKYDQFGNTLWEKTDTGFTNHIYLNDMCLGDNGNIYSAGQIATVNTGFDAYLSKYDTTGNLLWQRIYN